MLGLKYSQPPQTQLDFVLDLRHTLVSEQDPSRLSPHTVEVDRDLITVALYHQAPHQDGLVSQHHALLVAHIFKHHLVPLRQVHIHHL